MKTKNEIKASLDYEISKIVSTRENSALLEIHLQKLHAFFYSLDSLRYCYFYPADANVIVGIHSRHDFAKIRALNHGAIWSKSDATELGDGNIVRYNARIDGIKIDIRLTELPPSCRVVEEERIVPEHKEIVRRLVCSEPAQQDAPRGKILSIETVPTEF